MYNELSDVCQSRCMYSHAYGSCTCQLKGETLPMGFHAPSLLDSGTFTRRTSLSSVIGGLRMAPSLPSSHFCMPPLPDEKLHCNFCSAILWNTSFILINWLEIVCFSTLINRNPEPYFRIWLWLFWDCTILVLGWLLLGFRMWNKNLWFLFV